MSISAVESAIAAAPARHEVVNDFQIEVATVNGSGSQSANLVLMRSIFRMGVPVSAKNLFPSNIEGLPTWFDIRVSEKGYLARREGVEILVALNESTLAEDVSKLGRDAVALTPDNVTAANIPDGVHVYRVPFKALAKKHATDVDSVKLMTNMVYVGVVAYLLGIEMQAVDEALNQQFRKRAKIVASNLAVVQEGWDWAQANIRKEDPYRVERRDLTAGRILVDGNTAAGMGAVFGGLQVLAWYPITPATGVNTAAEDYLNRLRRDPVTGTATFAVVQAEDELAAIGIVLGAGWAGARAMTATSGPGLSLMTEFVGLGFFAEIPSVIWDVTRVGPSTGLPTRTSQGDLLFAHRMGHGDCRHPVLLPGSAYECFEMGASAFDLAERLQTPVLVLSDLDLGMNTHMSLPFPYPDKPMDRGKVLTAEQLEAMRGFKRYADPDGDGIGYRTLPGTDSPWAAYFTRGTGHNDAARYSERPDDWENNLRRLHKKIDGARALVPPSVVEQVPGAEVGLICFGSTQFAVQEARDRLADSGLKTGYLRVKGLPFTAQLREFVAAHERVIVIENNLTGQMADLIQLELPEFAGRVRRVCHLDGLPLSARYVVDAIEVLESKEMKS